MKKLLLLIAFCLTAVSADAAVSDTKIVDDGLIKQAMQKSNLNQTQLDLYRHIFNSIKANDIAKADELFKQVGKSDLNGHILAQKYLSRDYKSSYTELQNWLKKYPDLPQFSAISALAITKAPGYKKAPPAKSKKIYAHYKWYKNDYKKLKPDDRKFVKDNVYDFLLAIRRTDNDKATEIMKNTRFRMTIPDADYDGMSATLAASYFYDGDYEKALSWTKKAVRRSKEPTAAWFGGLAAWKLGDFATAGNLFAQLSGFNDEDKWLMSSAAYWAYRASQKQNKTAEAQQFLQLAASYKRTFYGILAASQLGQKNEYNWQKNYYLNKLKGQAYQQELLKSPIIRRAVLLLALGEKDLAADDLKKNLPQFTPQQQELIMLLSEQYDFPNLSFLVANKLKNYGQKRDYDAFMYPYPQWQPQGGWKVNRSWIWALVRQESLFDAKIRSFAGACGLMQIMPATATLVTGNQEYKKGCKLLTNRQNNLNIGQKYVEMLQQDKVIGNNMFFLAAAYNGGPHSVKKWLDKQNFDDDPLLFVEMIPWRETRLYVKKVVANYWLYNLRRGKKSQSLQQLVRRHWPILD